MRPDGEFDPIGEEAGGEGRWRMDAIGICSGVKEPNRVCKPWPLELVMIYYGY